MNAKQKTKWLRSEHYLAWVRTLPSVVSGQFGCVAHHLIGHGRCGTQKTHDYWAMPLTDSEHKELHNYGWSWWEVKGGSQWKHVAKTLRTAMQSGVLDHAPLDDLDMFILSGFNDQEYCDAIIGCIEAKEITLNKKAALGRENIL